MAPDLTATASPTDALRAVWRKHRAGVLKRVELIERALRALTVAELDEQLRVEAQHAAHSLIGSTGTLGFLGASEAARELERELADPSPARTPVMSELIAAIYRDLEGEALESRGAQRSEPTCGEVSVLVVDDDHELCERIAAEAVSREIAARRPPARWRRGLCAPSIPQRSCCST